MTNWFSRPVRAKAAPLTPADIVNIAEDYQGSDGQTHRLAAWLAGDPRLKKHFRELEKVARQAGEKMTWRGLARAWERHRQVDRLLNETWDHPGDVLDPECEGIDDYKELLGIIRVRCREAKGSEFAKLDRVRQALQDARRQEKKYRKLVAELDLPLDLAQALLKHFRKVVG